MTFLSYNHVDLEAVLELRDRLEASGVDTWLTDALEAGDLWMEALERNLGRSSSIVICVGPSGLGSFQKHFEVPIAVQLFTRKGTRVIPVILSGAESEPETLVLLGAFQTVDLRAGSGAGLKRLVRALLREQEVSPVR